MKKQYFIIIFIIMFASTYYSDSLVQNEISDVKTLVKRMETPTNTTAQKLRNMKQKIDMLETNRKTAYTVFLSASIFLLFIAGYALYYRKGAAPPNPLTAHAVYFVRGLFSKAGFWCKPSQGISKNQQESQPEQGREQQQNEKQEVSNQEITSEKKDPEAQYQLKRLLKYMEQEKPYLESDLTVRTLARRLSMPQKELSRIINDNLDMNFWKFVNRYRIREAKKLLAQTGNGSRSILEIAYDAGFNSKSSFNEVFKKHLNMTPTKYKQAYCH